MKEKQQQKKMLKNTVRREILLFEVFMVVTDGYKFLYHLNVFVAISTVSSSTYVDCHDIKTGSISNFLIFL